MSVRELDKGEGRHLLLRAGVEEVTVHSLQGLGTGCGAHRQKLKSMQVGTDSC